MDKMVDYITFPRFIISISIVGVYVLNHRHMKEGFLVFAVSAGLWVIYDLGIGAYEQAATCAFSTVASIYGWWKWRYDEKRGR